MGVTIRKYFQLKIFRIRMQETSTVHVYPGLENSWCASTKRAEIEVLSCVRGYDVYKDR